jgi:hypothetical protein
MTAERDQQRDGKRRPSAPLNPITSQWAQHAQKRLSAIVDPVELALPSGLTVRARRARMVDLMRLKMIPDPFTASVSDWIAKLESDNPTAAAEEDIKQDIVGAVKRFNDVLRGIWLACVVDPEFTTDESRAMAVEPPFHVDIVDSMDLLYLYRWAQGVDESIESFLREQAEIMGGVVASESVSLPAE